MIDDDDDDDDEGRCEGRCEVDRSGCVENLDKMVIG